MRIAIHQPDLLPYSGFWYKMAVSDGFIVSRHDQFQKHGYQRRVKMRDAWASHLLEGKPSLVPITEVVVREGWQRHLVDVIRGRYQGSRHWKDRGAVLIDRIAAAEGHSLDEVNLALIEIVREMLGVTTPLLFTDPPRHNGPDRLIEQVKAVGGDAYLSGAGGRAYMGEEAEADFAAQGISLEWSRHEHSTGDSIVTVLMDADDPMEHVMRESEDSHG